MTPPLTVQVLPAASTRLLTEGIMLPLGEAWPLAAPQAAPLELLLEPLALLLPLAAPLVAAPQAGMPPIAGCDATAQAPATQLHHMQLLFSW